MTTTSDTYELRQLAPIEGSDSPLGPNALRQLAPIEGSDSPLGPRFRLDRDPRGAVYVEFLIAFLPLFLIFLGICQLALVGAAEVIVRHSAYSAVRSAIVVIYDSNDRYDRAPKGSLSAGSADSMKGIDEVAEKLGIHAMRSRGKAATERAPVKGLVGYVQSMTTTALSSLGGPTEGRQQGARMVPIRTAAQLPLLTLAPRESLRNAGAETLRSALNSIEESQLRYALDYVKAATAVSLHDAPGTEAPITEPVKWNASVTAKVQFAFQCNVPLVRNLMCRSLDQLLSTRYGSIVHRDDLKSLVNPAARFKLLTAEATLPNQGAEYEDPKPESR